MGMPASVAVYRASSLPWACVSTGPAIASAEPKNALSSRPRQTGRHAPPVGELLFRDGRIRCLFRPPSSRRPWWRADRPRLRRICDIRPDAWLGLTVGGAVDYRSRDLSGLFGFWLSAPRASDLRLGLDESLAVCALAVPPRRSFKPCPAAAT